MQNNIIINFLGDIMLGERFEKMNRGVLSGINKGLDPFQFCKNDLLAADINIANLECVVSTTSKKSFPFSKFMLIEPDKLDLLLENNIKIVNIANNHIFDHGQKAFFETRENLDKKGIKYFGFDEGTGIQKKPLEINYKNKKIGLLGYDLSNTDLKKFNKKVDKITEVLSSLYTKFDLFILSLHWGYEYSNSPTSFMIKAAEKFFDCGVDILYGHHPHILHGITNIDGKVFVPSLGNFIFDDERKRNRFTGILNIEFDDKNNYSYNFKTYMNNSEFQPVPNEELINKFDKLTEVLEVHIQKTNNNEFDFDNEIFRNSELGHANNMKRVRKEIISHFQNYVPFIYPIFKDKIINKRLNKFYR